MIIIIMTRIILIIIEAKVMAIVIAKNKVIKEKKKFSRNWWKK